MIIFPVVAISLSSALALDEPRRPIGEILSGLGFRGVTLKKMPNPPGVTFRQYYIAIEDDSSPLKRIFIGLQTTTTPRRFDLERGKPNSAGFRMNAGHSEDWATPDQVPSGLPFAFDCAFQSGDMGSMSIMGSASRVSVSVDILSRGRIVNRNIEWPSFDMAARDALAEKIARWALAQAVGDDLTPSGTWRFNGRDCAVFRDSQGRRHCRASDWAQSWGYRRNLNLHAGRVSISTPQGDLLLILGSPKAKLGSQWIELPEVVAARDDAILIPEAVIARFSP